ncbi:Putative Sin3 binding protein [Metschnikowia aff. pulcherrima]|uniref:Sin3 binding protein n=1 Tax=Metschnikowia aff. pulcherrima TaxID=2163413 RepID=A0A4P6XE92_9ASCO|nr:Putative Sin3 binding protein [Metschnikowia aff. pulcherrima]
MVSQTSSLSPSPEAGAEKKHTTKLSTSSPEAIRVASEITPNRLANLLIRKGPLAIRLITSQLSVEVPGFDLLSLSKQRRLIMAAMEQGDPENDVVFEKIGWGQWAVRHLGSDYIVTEPNGGNANQRVNIHELKEKAKLGWLKKLDAEDSSGPVKNTKTPTRRDSISNHKSNMHNFRLPGERMQVSNLLTDSELDSDNDEIMDQGAQMRDLKMKFVNDGDDNAIDEDSDEDMMEEDDALFKFDDDEQNTNGLRPPRRLPPLKFANRVPTKFSPPPVLANNRRKLSSAMAPNAVVKNTSLHGSTRHAVFNRSRLNSMENLDGYILSSARNSSLSVLSPTVQNSLLPSTLPLGSWNGKGDYLGLDFPLPTEHLTAALQNAGRRKLSFNESSIRSTLSSSLPRGQSGAPRPYDNGVNAMSTSAVSAIPGSLRKSAAQDIASDTDEEDWATMGAETLRSHLEGAPGPAAIPAGKNLQNEERTAAHALVDLMGI